jgi:hypothetical protein
MPRVLFRRPCSPHRRRGRLSQGMVVLPIAIGGSLLLLLSSGSLQLLTLHSRVQIAQQQRRAQLEDTLASAAQQMAAALAGPGRCLLAYDRSQWPEAAATCDLDAAALEALQRGQVADQAYQLKAYRPAAAGRTSAAAEFELQLTGARPWRAAYRLLLSGEPGAPAPITAVQELGLLGVRS